MSTSTAVQSEAPTSEAQALAAAATALVSSGKATYTISAPFVEGVLPLFASGPVSEQLGALSKAQVQGYASGTPIPRALRAATKDVEGGYAHGDLAETTSLHWLRGIIAVYAVWQAAQVKAAAKAKRASKKA